MRSRTKRPRPPATDQEANRILGFRPLSHRAIIKNAVLIEKDNLCELMISNLHENVHRRLVNCLLVALDFFEISNCVDEYDQAWQYELALKKNRPTRHPFF